MHIDCIKTAAVLCTLLIVCLPAAGRAAGYMSGLAEVGYVTYDAETEGSEVFSGTTFAQKYSVAYNATNLKYKSQDRYYTAKLGYDWTSFNTDVTILNQEATLKDSYGKLRYSADVGFAAAELPITVRAYINDDQPTRFKFDYGSYTLIPDGLIYAIEGRGKTVSSGLSLAFLPEYSRDGKIRALPRLFLDYRQTDTKISEGAYRADFRIRELAVAGLNQQDNWIHYRLANYENFLDPSDDFTRQQLQIGLVDHVGRRKWAALTNWIEVSADGQLTNINSASADRSLEEYDVNLMAIATRKLWSARTFMNYNRLLDPDGLTEIVRLPLSVKGVYGAETDWYLGLAATRERQRLFNQNSFNTSASNSISAGGTTFTRSRFTLSPSVSLQTSRDYYGNDAYSFAASLESVSTRRFSEKFGLAGRLTFRGTDNGLGVDDSKTWSTVMNLDVNYAPGGSFSYSVREILEVGNGSGYLDGSRILYGTANSAGVGTYLRNYLAGTSRWVPTARFSADLSGSYEYLQATGIRSAHNTVIQFQTGYNNQETSYRFDLKYQRSQNGYDPVRDQLLSLAEVQYRPDRYHDGLFRVVVDRQNEPSYDRTKVDVLQRYNYNLFTRAGLVRTIATLTEESGYISDDYFGIKNSSTYIIFSGRYNPTARLSLYGSVKYETNDPGSKIMYYSAGMNADFRLLSTSLDYAYAKRDIDNRIEKKLSAYLRRQF